MSQANQVNPMNGTAPPQEALRPEILNVLFAQLNPGDIEQLYKSYQAWTLQRQRVALLTQVAILQQKIMENADHMQRLVPSALALASLTQLQACGVEDIDLLERMLERGEAWLDHTIQLLIRCEQLDLIGSNYTEWCEHALEGAYDWIDSIGEENDETTATPVGVEQGSTDTTAESSARITEELILQKLMSDDEEADETEKLPMMPTPKITQPLSIQDLLSSHDEYTKTQDSMQELGDTPVAGFQFQLSADATGEAHDIEEIGEEEQIDRQQAEEADIEAGDAIDLADVSISEEMEQASLVEHPEQEPAEEASIEARDAIDLNEAIQADVSIGEEIEQASLVEYPEQEPVEEASIEARDAIDLNEAIQADVSIGEEIEQASLVEYPEQEPAEEENIGARDAIDLTEALQADDSTSEEMEQASLVEYPEQEPAEEASIEAGDAIDLAEA